MKLHLENALKNQGQSYHAQFCEYPVEGECPPGVALAQPLDVSVDYMFAGNVLTVRGTLHAVLQTSCARCLKDLTPPMTVEFCETFLRDADGQAEGYAFSGDAVTLDTMLLDQIALELPARFLCADDCKGLCPVCGANLNITSCGCDREQKISPFAGLKKLLDDGGVE